MSTTLERPVTPAATDATRFLWLELTGRCNLECVQCYASSGPDGSHGVMAVRDWFRVLDQGRALGVRMVSLIGGEPTLHPDFAQVLVHALALNLAVEVYSNLYAVPVRTWDLLRLPGVRVATSYYSDDAAEHDRVTARAGSHARTLANIREAVRRGIMLRVGLIGLWDGQRTEQARAELVGLGVDPGRIGFDRVRAFGRGAVDGCDESQSCGGCGHGRAAVLPDGSVAPCVFTRGAVAGSVLGTDLGAVLAGAEFCAQVARLDGLLVLGPDPCKPDCVPSCRPWRGGPCEPTTWVAGSGQAVAAARTREPDVPVCQPTCLPSISLPPDDGGPWRDPWGPNRGLVAAYGKEYPPTRVSCSPERECAPIDGGGVSARGSSIRRCWCFSWWRPGPRRTRRSGGRPGARCGGRLTRMRWTCSPGRRCGCTGRRSGGSPPGGAGR